MFKHINTFNKARLETVQESRNTLFISMIIIFVLSRPYLIKCGI